MNIAPFNNLTSNKIITNGSSGHGIFLNGGSFNVLINNQINASGSSAVGVAFSSANSNVLTNNEINVSGSSGNGISLSSADSNTIDNNSIMATHATENQGITLSGTSFDNILLNNNISVVALGTINDTTGDSNINYLVYNNSFGEIRWAEDSAGGFLKDMDVNDGDIGLGINLFIGNNTVALNTSAFSSEINSSANISFYNLPFTTITEIYKNSNYTENATEIKEEGKKVDK